ncbi:hypothetical protein Pph01_78000 [Planotetraspora phitsanulokensis]|uniref:Uncharacterized protein n=1 Tax=Planotetraspora phitsanulokensis TaxID=575192 RepID=A0A8J3UDE7_9ACTN|nr:hypothetical protein Pph01_78000 [Planotetraspora phitsanulokensis]
MQTTGPMPPTLIISPGQAAGAATVAAARLEVEAERAADATPASTVDIREPDLIKGGRLAPGGTRPESLSA